MGKPTNGPDMEDCATYAQAISESQNCTISVLLECVTQLECTSWRVGVVACSRELTVDGPAWSAATYARWPSRGHKVFEAALYGLLAQIDGEIGRKAFQRELGIA